MFLGTQKVQKIENDTVFLEDGTELTMTEAARKRTITEGSDEKTFDREESELAKKLLEIISARDIRLSLEKETLEKNQTDIVADIVRHCGQEDYETSMVIKALGDIVSVIKSVQGIYVNNIDDFNNSVYVKALGLEKSGKSNGERMRGVRFNHLETYLKNG
jgi:hypothetical protein